jgi:hypothetical protein
MKRLLLILLLIALPFQMTWASAARYCLHEQGKAAQHFGHHEHQHHASAQEPAKDQKSSKSLAVDTDCGVCQFNITAISALHIGNLAAYPPQTTLAFATFDFITSLRPVRPERPKWGRAA